MIKKNKIRVLMALMSAAMLGLLVFQGYFLLKAVKQNKEAFDREVADALRSVSLQLEKDQAKNFFLAQKSVPPVPDLVMEPKIPSRPQKPKAPKPALFTKRKTKTPVTPECNPAPATPSEKKNTAVAFFASHFPVVPALQAENQNKQFVNNSEEDETGKVKFQNLQMLHSIQDELVSNSKDRMIRPKPILIRRKVGNKSYQLAYSDLNRELSVTINGGQVISGFEDRLNRFMDSSIGLAFSGVEVNTTQEKNQMVWRIDNPGQNVLDDTNTIFMKGNVSLLVNSNLAKIKSKLSRRIDSCLPEGCKKLNYCKVDEPKTKTRQQVKKVKPETSQSAETAQNLALLKDTLAKLEEKLKNKSAVAFEVLEQYLLDNPNPAQLITKKQMDSLLQNEFRNRGLFLKTEYGVWEGKEKAPQIITNLNKTNELEQSVYKASLFPNELFANQATLKVFFPDLQQYLIGKLWVMALSSIFLAILVIGTFSMAFNTILKQKKLSEMKDDFINNMTHEFKTPVTTISLACEAIQDIHMNPNPEKTQRFVSMIAQENKRMEEQIEKVLQLARLDKEKPEWTREPVDFNEIITESLSQISFCLNARNGSIKTQFAPENGLVSGDPMHFRNIISNLLDNAIKYSPETPEISLETSIDNQQFVIRISDKGLGIKPEMQPYVFDKFFRVPTGKVHDVKGFGLGLHYVKTVTDVYDGTISLVSNPGQGSTFELRFPLQSQIQLG